MTKELHGHSAARLVVLVALLAVAAGCGGNGNDTLTPPTTATVEADSGASTEATEPSEGDEDASEPEGEPGDFVKQILERRAKGQHARVWEVMHPLHKEKVPRSLYARCEDAAEFAGELTDVRVLEVYDEPSVIPGTADEVMSKAVTIEMSVNVPLLEDTQKVTDTAHAFAVDGKWAWVLTDEDWQAYSEGECPPGE